MPRQKFEKILFENLQAFRCSIGGSQQNNYYKVVPRNTQSQHRTPADFIQRMIKKLPLFPGTIWLKNMHIFLSLDRLVVPRSLTVFLEFRFWKLFAFGNRFSASQFSDV